MTDYMYEQKHAGKRLSDGENIWHTNSKGGYWSGWMPSNLTPEELYYACITTISDLLSLHPELANSLTVKSAKRSNTASTRRGAGARSNRTNPVAPRG